MKRDELGGFPYEIGSEKMQKYLSNKKAVDPPALKHLDSIAKKVKAV